MARLTTGLPHVIMNKQLATLMLHKTIAGALHQAYNSVEIHSCTANWAVWHVAENRYEIKTQMFGHVIRANG